MDAVRLCRAVLPAVDCGPGDPQDMGKVFLRKIQSFANLSKAGGTHVRQFRPAFLCSRPLKQDRRLESAACPGDPASLEVKADFSRHRPRGYVVSAAKR